MPSQERYDRDKGDEIVVYLHAGDGPDVILAGEHELFEHAPHGLVVEDGGRVDGHDLVVLHRKVVARSLQVRHLSRGTRRKKRTDSDSIGGRFEAGGGGCRANFGRLSVNAEPPRTMWPNHMRVKWGVARLSFDPSPIPTVPNLSPSTIASPRNRKSQATHR